MQPADPMVSGRSRTSKQRYLILAVRAARHSALPAITLPRPIVAES